MAELKGEYAQVDLQRFVEVVDQLEAQRREEWRVPVSAADLREVCASRVGYHSERVEYWQGEQGRLGGELRESALELREQQVTGGPRFTAAVDQELGQQYAEAQKRLGSHRAARDRYAGWVRFFDLAGEAGQPPFELTAEDLRFFAARPEGVDEDMLGGTT